MTNNFIGIYENAIPYSVCDELISFFERCDALGVVKTRQQRENVNKILKTDDSLLLTEVLDVSMYGVVHDFADLFWTIAYQQYVNEYSTLVTVAEQTIFQYRIQRTPVGGGYHLWHAEQGDIGSSSRVLSFTGYLNDVAEGGETEFLYYPKRIPAKKGTICLFPGGFTHAHRGNPPLSNTKYIITGWVQFCK